MSIASAAMIQGSYDFRLVALSILFAVFASYAALDLVGRLTAARGSARMFWLCGGALSMGLGIWSMHYIGMLALRLPIPVLYHYPTVILSLLAAVAASAVALFTVSRERVRAAIDGEARFHTLAETIPQIVWTAIPGSGLDYCNHRWSELTGLPVDTALGSGWQNSVHPDDLPLAMQGWESANPTGAAFEIEYRLRAASGDFRWHLFRAVPVCDSSGVIVKWFGTCVDIEDQRRNQQHLEDQIKVQTAALLEANMRLEGEMRERALAQHELNQQTARVMQELQTRSNRATTLAKMAELLQSCVDLKDAFLVIKGMAPKIFPELRGAALLLNSSRDLLEVVASWSDCNLSAAVFAPHDCWALRTGHLHTVAAGDATAQCKHVPAGEGSYFCLPLFSQGETAGVVHFQIVDAAASGSESLMLLVTMFSEQVGMSISNLRLREALHSQSIRDPLTGLYNRRYLEEMTQRETRRAVRSEYGLGLLILDLDHFKKINDTYGHHAGDAVLREASSFLVKSVRAEDIVCRFGGEEFVVVLPMADLKATQARAERIRSRLRELTVLHKGESLGMITASIGVAALPEHGTSPKELLEAADAALYLAKREGRDRVVVATRRPDPEAGLSMVEKISEEQGIHVS